MKYLPLLLLLSVFLIIGCSEDTTQPIQQNNDLSIRLEFEKAESVMKEPYSREGYFIMMYIHNDTNSSCNVVRWRIEPEFIYSQIGDNPKWSEYYITGILDEQTSFGIIPAHQQKKFLIVDCTMWKEENIMNEARKHKKDKFTEEVNQAIGQAWTLEVFLEGTKTLTYNIAAGKMQLPEF